MSSPQSKPIPTATLSAAPVDSKPKKGSAFWLSFLALAVSIFLSAIDLTAVGTALPTVTKALNGGDDFSWVGSAYALTSTAILPLSGSLADIFGRKPIMLVSIAFFAVGSAIAGASHNMHMLIAARAVQGIGGGGIINLTEIIVSDLVPLAERGVYQGLIGLVWAVASGIGPPVGGAFAQHGAWRWLFYMNLPLTGVAFALVVIFLRVRSPNGSILTKLARVDWSGSAIIMAGSTLVIIGLTWGGIQYPWSSANVLAPLIIGLVLIGAFFVFEAKVPREPTIPWEVVTNRTSLGGFVGTFVHGLASISVIYYLPVYFQACLNASPIRSGVQSLPTALVIAPFAMICGVTVQIMNKYRPVNAMGWILMIIGLGLLCLLKANSDASQWIGFQIVAAAGTGLIYASTVFAILAPLPVERTASALAFFAFLRAFGQTWGITISSTILQNELKRNIPAAFASQFPQGSEIAYSAIPIIPTLPEPLRTEVRVAFASSMATVWKTMIGICGLGFLSVLLLKEIPMLKYTDGTYGLHEQEPLEDTEKAVSDDTVDTGETSTSRLDVQFAREEADDENDAAQDETHVTEM
ncbi:Efflux pump FUS6 [Sparassis crispa]|uniref:Efflux pump FUS6 n=1 Tax=Sparassis crispa TaxID=139825 RepID=A0A401GVQ1_9APHY|nr:Efflux pump FUS6 [Sparassis crispa]GBE86270.1 Efflux pump FUS6 [Sparassis crispa]